jgi:hypothetical protein
VLPTLAERIGLNESIVLQQVHYWLRNSKNVIDGQKWTFDTYEDWQQKNFKFWSVKTVQRAFLSLEERGLLISMQPDKRDRRKWYTIDYDLLEKLSSDTHTPDDRFASGSPPTGQNDLLQEDNLSLSDGTTCPLASGHVDLLGDDNLSSPSGQHVPLYKNPETSSENPGELTHTAARSSPGGNGNRNGQQACVCETPHRSKICDEERIRIASNLPGVITPEFYAMTPDARRGTFDAVYLKHQRQLAKPGATSTVERDTSICPDCHGHGFVYPGGDTPEGRKLGTKKCQHPRLESSPNALPNSTSEVTASNGR